MSASISLLDPSNCVDYLPLEYFSLCIYLYLCSSEALAYNSSESTCSSRILVSIRCVACCIFVCSSAINLSFYWIFFSVRSS